MREVRLSASALWETIQKLTEGEFRQIKAYVKGTRLEWLLERLRRMESYAEDRLHAQCRRAFPGITTDAIRAYKKQLWSTLETLLPLAAKESLHEEIRIWQRFWVSELLWRRGLYEHAEVLWHQAMKEAIELGWYEVALWGFSLLELYQRDFHRFTSTEEINQWGKQLLHLVSMRYQSLQRKVEASEKHVRSRHPRGLHLPTLPTQDSWAEYLDTYSRFFDVACQLCTEEALEITLEAMDRLLERPRFPSRYRRFHLAINYLNLGTQLLYRSPQKGLFEKWYALWEHAWRNGYWHEETPIHSLHQMALSLQLGYLMRHAAWEQAYTFWMSHRGELEKYIFNEWGSMGARAALACMIYALLLLLPGKQQEAIAWRLQAEPWMESRYREDDPYLRWVFLRWYEAFLSGERTWIRHWYRKLRQIHQRHFSALYWWQPLIRALRGITEGLPLTRKRRIQNLLHRWELNSEERRFWEGYEALVFPMKLFLHSLLEKRPIQTAKPPEFLSLLPPTLERRAEAILRRFAEEIQYAEQANFHTEQVKAPQANAANRSHLNTTNRRDRKYAS
ncbi:MAG: hypothetical protein N2170_07715 [Bacteroidia bacterium]|nr:hypothetical protein [Bacteroidia bacterium]